LISEERKERDSYMASRQDTSTLWASVIYFLRLYYNFLEQFQVYRKIKEGTEMAHMPLAPTHS